MTKTYVDTLSSKSIYVFVNTYNLTLEKEVFLLLLYFYTFLYKHTVTRVPCRTKLVLL